VRFFVRLVRRHKRLNDGVISCGARGVPEARQIVTGSACPLDQVSLVEASTFTEEVASRSFRTPPSFPPIPATLYHPLPLPPSGLEEKRGGRE